MLDQNIIREPGKFEGEPVFIRYWWNDIVLNGFYNEVIYNGPADKPIYILYLISEAARELGKRFCLLWEDENGFVHHQLIEEAELKKLEAGNRKEIIG